MRIEGAIRPISGAVGFSHQKWCQLVRRRPEFRPYPPRQGQPTYPRHLQFSPPEDLEDAAEVWLNGRVVGNVHWSNSGAPLVNVSVDRSAVSLVLEWATALEGEFREERVVRDDSRVWPTALALGAIGLQYGLLLGVWAVAAAGVGHGGWPTGIYSCVAVVLAPLAGVAWAYR